MRWIGLAFGLCVGCVTPSADERALDSADTDGDSPEPADAAPADTAPADTAPSDATGHPAAGTAPGLPEPAMPGPARKRGDWAVIRNAQCVACHEREAEQWHGSLHQRANIDEAYRSAFELEPLPFCRSCHAPEAVPTEAPPADVSSLGVACVTCHVTGDDDTVLAAAHDGNDRLRTDQEAHPIRYSTAFASEAACASCHEFRFPGRTGSSDGDFMQTTLREHAASPAADKPCAACHMPGQNGGRSHQFDQVRDPTWLQKRLRADAEISEFGSVHISLTQETPAHAFPTGDLFRRLEVGAEARLHDGTSQRRAVRYLERELEVGSGSFGRTLRHDDRIMSDTVDVELDLQCPTDPDGEIVWWVKLQRVATVGTGREPAHANVESETLIHEGTLCREPRGMDR